MELNSGTALVGAILVALCALPFVLDRISRSRKENRLLGSLRAIAHQHDRKVEKHGSCGHNALGMDKSTKALFLYSQQPGREVADFIDLNEIRTCRTVKVARSAQGLQGDASIEQLALGFVPKDTNAKEKQFELYHVRSGNFLTDELEFADKWTKLINERL